MLFLLFWGGICINALVILSCHFKIYNNTISYIVKCQQYNNGIGTLDFL